MAFSLFQNILSKFRGAYSVGLGGGEPFLHKEIFKMIEYGRIYGIRATLNMNGTLISDKIDQIIASSPLLLSISLNATSAVEYEKISNVPSKVFEEVQNIVTLAEKRNIGDKSIKLGISYVCTKENYRKIPDMAKLTQELGVDQAHFINLGPIPKEGFTKNQCLYKNDKDVVEVIKSLDKAKFRIRIIGPNLYKENFDKSKSCCSQPFDWIKILPDGDVFTCCCNVVRADNILYDHDVWNNDIFQTFRKKMTSGDLSLLPNMCNTCSNYDA